MQMRYANCKKEWNRKEKNRVQYKADIGYMLRSCT
jgi:hypothetical protein